MKDKLRRAKESLSLALRLVAVAMIVAVVIWKYDALVHLDVRTLIGAGESLLAGIGIALGVYAVKSLVFVIPAMVIYTSIGMIFPLWQALLINAAGIALEVALTWVAGRVLGGEYVENYLSNSRFGNKLLKVKNSTKYPAFFGIRALPVFPIDFVSLFIGTTKMKFGPYMLISFFGILPRVILFTVLGDKVYDLIPMKYIVPAVIGIALIVAVVWIVKYMTKMKKGIPWKYGSIKETRRNLILDTDMGPDCDDAGALAVLIKLMADEELKPLGVVNCTSNPQSNGVIRSILAFTGNGDIPVAQTERADFLADNSSYAALVSNKYADGVLSALPAVGFYRECLEKSEDDSVVLVSIGMLNNISDLLNAYPKLVEKKVHALVAMAGSFPEGREYNIYTDTASAKNVIENLPCPIIFSGFEVGKKIITGFPEEPDNASCNPVYECYLYHNAGDANRRTPVRESWDLTAVHFAVEGEGEYYRLSNRMKVTVDDEGNNTCEQSPRGNRYYLQLASKPKKLEEYLNSVLHSWNNVLWER